MGCDRIGWDGMGWRGMEGAEDGGARVLVVGIKHASHSWSWGIAVEEGIGPFPAIAVRGADGTHLVVVQHHRSVRNVDDEGI